MTRLVLPFLLVVAMLAGCSSNGGPGTEPTSGPAPEPVCIADAFLPAPDFVGLDQAAAEELAAERNLEVRVVGRDGECFPVTDDLRQDRINLEYHRDEVIAASVY